jgi:hypothetical protein
MNRMKLNIKIMYKGGIYGRVREKKKHSFPYFFLNTMQMFISCIAHQSYLLCSALKDGKRVVKGIKG